MLARGERTSHTLRLRARRIEVKAGAVHPHDGKDVDHIDPLSKGITGRNPNAPSDLRVESAKKNRSYARTSKGAIK
jgi:hypothetical protein